MHTGVQRNGFEMKLSKTRVPYTKRRCKNEKYIEIITQLSYNVE